MAGGYSVAKPNTNFLSYCGYQGGAGATNGQAQLTLETLPLALALARARISA